MENIIKVIVLLNNQVLITKIDEVLSDIGEPDCKLIKPFEIKKSDGDNVFFIPWNSDYTSQEIFMIQSDKILTLVDPKPTLLEKYQSLIK
jgi:hypothetical protein